MAIEDIYDPFTAYLNKLGLGTRNYLNPAEIYQTRQFEPLKNLFDIQGRMGTVQPSMLPNTGYFADYSPSGGVHPQAQNILNTLWGWNPEQRAQAGMAYEPTYAEGRQTSTGNVDELAQLLLSALRPSLGQQGSRWVAGQLPAEQGRWIGAQAASPGGTGTGETFLDYLRRKYNLSNLGPAPGGNQGGFGYPMAATFEGR